MLAGGLGLGAAGSAQASEQVIFDGPVPESGVWGSQVALLQIDLRSVDGYSACYHALNVLANTFTTTYCTTSLSSAGYGGGVIRQPRIFSGRSGFWVDMRGRQYW
jgi:hypothetical protein